jgi:hypothetical protein
MEEMRFDNTSNGPLSRSREHHLQPASIPSDRCRLPPEPRGGSLHLSEMQAHMAQPEGNFAVPARLRLPSSKPVLQGLA